MDSASFPVCVTQDVDAIVQVVSPADYYHLSEKLRARRFIEGIGDDAPVYRRVAKHIVLISCQQIQEFSVIENKWYAWVAEKH